MEKAFSTGASLLYRAFNHGRTPAQQQKYKKDLKLAQEKAQALEERPAPLPKHRINLSQSDFSSQPASLLFQKLPPEIRARIWQEVLGRSVLHFSTPPKSVSHQRLPLPSPEEEEQYQQQQDQDATSTSPAFIWSKTRDDLPANVVDLRVLRTCHAIYAECQPALWSSNTIAATSPLTLLYLHDYILPLSHFVQIRRLRFEYVYFANPEVMHARYIAEHDSATWLRFWQLVAQQMPQLTSLWARIGYIGPLDAEGEIDTTWTQPMLQVTGLKDARLNLQALTRPSEGFQRKERLGREIEERWRSGSR